MAHIKLLVIALNIGMLTACYGQSGSENKICLTIPEMDYFIYQDLSQKALVKDTAEYKIQLRSKNNQIALLKANEYDLKESVRVQKMLADNYKSAAVQFQDKYSKAQDKAKFRGKVLIGSLVVNVVFIAGLIVLVK
jgi:hypothetical protein